jgi:hypothetical protein
VWRMKRWGDNWGEWGWGVTPLLLRTTVEAGRATAAPPGFRLLSHPIHGTLPLSALGRMWLCAAGCCGCGVGSWS